MPKYKAEVEYDDDGAAMAGARCGTQRRARFFEIEAKDKDAFEEALKAYFRTNMYYATVRRIGTVCEA